MMPHIQFPVFMIISRNKNPHFTVECRLESYSDLRIMSVGLSLLCSDSSYYYAVFLID